MTTLNKQVEEIKNFIFQETNNVQEKLSILLDKKLLNHIPESLFVNYFLPRFTGNIIDEKYVLEWISIAGSPMAEVGIIKDGTNEILFYVPSILATNSITLRQEEGDIGDIVEKYNNINNNSPIQGLNFFLEALNNKANEYSNLINLNEISNRWKAILEKYNYINNNKNIENNSFFNSISIEDTFEI